MVVETRVGKKRVIVIPKSVADEVKIVIEPVRDAVWLALYGKRIGRIAPEEVEVESLREQGRLQATA